MVNKIILLLLLSFPVNAHTFTGMIGFYDGLSHPVLGLDHFLAMVSVGVISAQIGGRAIWTLPSAFVFSMILGGFFGMGTEIFYSHLEKFISLQVELAIILSVIFLGIAILIEKKLSIKFIFIFIFIFGISHGIAHGIEIPWAANPFLFVFGFSVGTASLHLLGV